MISKKDTLSQCLKRIEVSFSEYTEKPVWVLSRIKDKVPINPYDRSSHASVNDPKTWAPFDKVRECVLASDDFLPAIVVTQELNLVAFDLDEPPPEKALELMQKLASYSETSMSGLGFHIFIRGKKPGKKCRSGFLEIYDDRKFITMTGDIVHGYDAIANDEGQVNEVYSEYFKESSTCDLLQKSPQLEDGEILKKFRESKNAAKFTGLFERGDISSHDNNRSSADMALACLIAFYTQDPKQVRRLMTKSKLKRDKWSRRDDYLEKTIEKAINQQRVVYQGEEQRRLWDPSVDEEPFPVELLPGCIKVAVDYVVAVAQAFPGSIATAAMGLASTATGSKVMVIEKQKAGLNHKIAMFHAVVGASAEARKSEGTKPFLRPFDAYHKREKGFYDEMMKKYQVAKNSINKFCRKIRDTESPEEYISKTAELEIALEEKKPKYYRLFTTDTTTQAFAKRLDEREGEFSVFSTDAGDIIDFIIGTPQGGTNDMIFVKLITGDSINVERVGPDRTGVTLDIPHPCGSITLFTQEERWERFCNNPRLRSSGLHGRCNPCIIPPRKYGYIEEGEGKDDIPERDASLKDWEDTITNILNHKGDPITIRLSNEAQEERRLFNNELQKTVGYEGENYDVADVIHRTVTEAVKRAALFHVLKYKGKLYEVPQEIPSDTFIEAVGVQRWFLSQAINVRRGTVSKQKALEVQKLLIRWEELVAQRKLKECTTSRELVRLTKKGNTQKIVELLEEAMKLGIVKIVDIDGARAPRYQLNLEAWKKTKKIDD